MLRHALLRRLAHEFNQLGYRVLLLTGFPHPYLPFAPIVLPLIHHAQKAEDLFLLLTGPEEPYLVLLLHFYGWTVSSLPSRRPQRPTDLVHTLYRALETFAQQVPTLLFIPEIQQADPETWSLVYELFLYPVPGLTLGVAGASLPPAPQEVLRLTLPDPYPDHLHEFTGFVHLPSSLRDLSLGPTAPLNLWLLEQALARDLQGPEPPSLPALLQSLSPETRSLLHQVACLPFPVSASLLATLLGQPGVDLENHLQELTEVGLLTEDQGFYFFPSPLLQERLYESLRPEERQQIHRELARHVPSHPPYFRPLEADQWERAGQVSKALHQWHLLAQDIVETRAWRTGLRVLHHLLRLAEEAGVSPPQPLPLPPLEEGSIRSLLLPPGDPTFSTLEDLAQRLLRLGALKAGTKVNEWLIHQQLYRGAYAAAEQQARQLLRAIREQGPQWEPEALKLLGICAWCLKKPEEAKRLWNQAIQQGEHLSPISRAQIAGNLGMAYMEEGDLNQARRLYQTVLEILLPTDPHPLTVVSLGMLARLEETLGNLGRALDLYQRAVHTARSIHELYGEATWSTELALLLRFLGLYEQASDLLKECAQRFQAIRNRYHQIMVQAILAEIHLLQGLLPQGEQRFQELWREAQESQDASLMEQIAFGWLSTLLSLGMDRAYDRYRQKTFAWYSSPYLTLWAQALRVTPQTFPKLQKAWKQVPTPRPAILRLAHDRFYLEAVVRGAPSTVKTPLQRAYAQLTQLAQSVRDPEMRQTFLSRNPHAVRILELLKGRHP